MVKIVSKIDILGTEYNFIYDDNLKEQEFDGLCKTYAKEIRVRNLTSMLDINDSNDEKKKRYEEVLRHEIVHAFFNESGLDDYSDDEQLVQWIAVQFPKMLETFKKMHCI